MTRTRTALPHSWSISNWPADVWPGNASRAAYVIRSNKDELMREGALSRVGRELIVFGARYSRFLEKKSANVPGYECPANREPA